ncbi:MAG: hypothetical protein COA73_10075 [Candidatus Hydrogenedentota bacterium]|nr:MAG: hypothetical protein COA73_10075 [Candidatus Hydrogenedentota bacterium]
MSIKENIQEAMKDAMRAKDTIRLECLRMAKGAILVKEKSSGDAVTDEDVVAVMRTEVKKRQQSIEMFEEHGKMEEADASRQEIVVLESFLPQQLSIEDLEAKVRAYLADHPDINHAGKLTGAMKKELGDAADGKMLNEICRKVLS